MRDFESIRHTLVRVLLRHRRPITILGRVVPIVVATFYAISGSAIVGGKPFGPRPHVDEKSFKSAAASPSRANFDSSSAVVPKVAITFCVASSIHRLPDSVNGINTAASRISVPEVCPQGSRLNEQAATTSCMAVRKVVAIHDRSAAAVTQARIFRLTEVGFDEQFTEPLTFAMNPPHSGVGV